MTEGYFLQSQHGLSDTLRSLKALVFVAGSPRRFPRLGSLPLNLTTFSDDALGQGVSGEFIDGVKVQF